MSTRDDVSELYSLPQKIDKIVAVLFFVNIIAASISLILPSEFKVWAYSSQVVVSLGYVVLQAVNDFWLWHKAESARSQSSIENAFDINMTEYVTDGYYNNSFPPSLQRYFVNMFESIYFSKNIAGRLRIKAFIKSLVAVLIFILAIMQVEQGALYPLIAQVVFSSYFLLSSIALFVYCSKLDTLYKACYRELITNGVSSLGQICSLLSCAIEYEMIKSRFNIHWSQKLFDSMNSELSDKWESLECKIRFDFGAYS